jgi:hypothetical protein
LVERQQEGEVKPNDGEFSCYFCTLLRSFLLGRLRRSRVEGEGVSNYCAADAVGIIVEQWGRVDKTGLARPQDLDDPVYLF